MMQRMIKGLEDNHFIVHAVYTRSDARVNLRKHQFSLVLIGGLDTKYWDEIKLFIDEHQADCQIIEGTPTSLELQSLLD